jgi:hypothetical protein
VPEKSVNTSKNMQISGVKIMVILLLKENMYIKVSGD